MAETASLLSLIGNESAGAKFWPLDQPDQPYRTRLWRTWSNASIAVFVMLNPSTADAFKLDPTVAKCMRYAKRWGCGGLQVVNLFALRSTDPKALRTAIKSGNDPIGGTNDAEIVEAILMPNVFRVVCAWGTHSAQMRRDDWMRAQIRGIKRVREHVEFVCLRMTKSGFPEHPLYIPENLPLLPFPPEVA